MCERAVLTNRPSLDLSPFVIEGQESLPGSEGQIGCSTRTVARALSPDRARKGVGVLSLAGDAAARFEAGADSSFGGGRTQHAVDRQGSWGPAPDRQPLAASLCRPWPGRLEGQAAAWQAADLYEDRSEEHTSELQSLRHL